jgi:ABC-type amino acid transport substrate-binding protein
MSMIEGGVGMRGRTRGRLSFAGLAVTALVVAACNTAAPEEGSSERTVDKLQQILDRGTLLLSVDPAYPPQSFGVAGAERAPDTRCAANQLTAPEVAGYDADTAKAVADALGVEPCFVTPSIAEITAAGWGDRWDITYGSFSIEKERMERLFVTQPYYAVPAVYFVADDSTFRAPADLAGASIGVCASCSMDIYLQGKLEIPQQDIALEVNAPRIVRYEVEQPGLEDVAAHEIDAFLTQEPVGVQAVAGGLSLREIEGPAYLVYSTGLVDKSSSKDPSRFIARVNDIVSGLLADGTLARLSEEYFGVDYASAAADFDIDALVQEGL